MTLQEQLTLEFASLYPKDAAVALEHRPPEMIAIVLRALPDDAAAAVIERMAPKAVARACDHMEAEVAGRLFTRLTVEAAVLVMRRMDLLQREAILNALPGRTSDAINAIIQFSPGTAGALMDSSLLALSSDLTVAASLDAIRQDIELVHYHVYVVDRDQVLVGVLNLQELLAADPKAMLESVMHEPIHQLDASMDRFSVVQHPGWRHVYSLPVVDGGGRFLGAIRYRTLRRLEREIGSDDTVSEALTIRALSDLFEAGMGGFVNALASTVSPKLTDESREDKKIPNEE